MTIENQSEFLKIQKTACEVVEPKEKEKDKVCPTCIPDPNALVPEWWSMDRPFLNKKTCCRYSFFLNKNLVFYLALNQEYLIVLLYHLSLMD